MPTNLTVASELEHWLVVPSKDVEQLLSDALVSTARMRLRGLLKTYYVGKPSALAKQFENAVPFILLWLSWGIDRVRAGNLDSAPFEGWPDLADTVIKAAEENAAAMLPQIAAMIVQEKREFRRKGSWEFLPKRCSTLFGDLSRVLRLFVEIPAALASNEGVQEVHRAALAADRETAIAGQIGSTMSAERAKGIELGSDVLSSGNAVTTQVQDALSKLALDQAGPPGERKRAIAILRAAGRTEPLVEPVLVEWFQEGTDEDLGRAFATMFFDAPVTLDKLCATLEALPVPKDEPSALVQNLGHAFAAIHAQLTNQPAQVGVSRASLCLAVAQRFLGLSALRPMIAQIQKLAPSKPPEPPEPSEAGSEDRTQ